MDQLSLFDIKKESSFYLDSFSAENFCVDTERQALEKKYAPYLVITEKFNRQSVSYQLSKKDILHSWLKYKEGFSANLVNLLLDEMNIQAGALVMDPFMGSGTTALVCKMRGINSIGYDILPISQIAIQAKSFCLEYNIEELQQMAQEIASLNMPNTFSECTPYIPITKDAYPEYTAHFLQFITDWIKESHYSSAAQNLLTLCIINSLEPISYTAKSGQYLSWDARSLKVQKANALRKEKGQKPLANKFVRNEILPAKETILTELIHVINDIKIIKRNKPHHNSAKINYIPNSCLYEIPQLPDNILDGVITSPPYCNRYDYTRTYALELAYLGLTNDDIKNLRQSLLSCTVESHSKVEQLEAFYKKIGHHDRFEYIYNKINQNPVFKEILLALEKRKEHHDLNNNGVIRMVKGYFTELAFLFAELQRICKPGASVAFVNDNVRYGGEVIPVDFLSTSFAESFGFNVKNIYALKQQKGNSSQQMAKFGKVPLRKGITIWTK